MHLSDLHFGAIDHVVAQTLLDELRVLGADLCVVTGDLTQRARHTEFRLARNFLASLPFDVLVVPGNHDVPPLYQPLRRLLGPFERYRRYFDSAGAPTWTDGHTVIVGLNTVRPWRWKEGTLTPRELTQLDARLSQRPGLVHVLATHHPLERPPGASRGRDAWRSKSSLFHALNVDLALSGHLHVGGNWALRAAQQVGGVVLAQAPSATSRRRRGEPNGYNWIVVGNGAITITVHAWTGSRFEPLRSDQFVPPAASRAARRAQRPPGSFRPSSGDTSGRSDDSTQNRDLQTSSSHSPSDGPR